MGWRRWWDGSNKGRAGESRICENWLESKEAGSVVYVSCRSLVKVSEEQMEVAWALKENNNYFLWVVRATEEDKLRRECMEAIEDKGFTVRWASHLDILAHRAIGCAWLHTGWKSTLDGLSLGVPMVSVPLWSDQPTNAKYMEDAWEVGVRAGFGELGVAGREEIEKCIKEVMEGERREEMLRNANKWGVPVVQALDEAGSSDISIDESVKLLFLLIFVV